LQSDGGDGGGGGGGDRGTSPLSFMPQRGAGERAPVNRAKEDGTEELCEDFTDDDADGDASERP